MKVGSVLVPALLLAGSWFAASGQASPANPKAIPFVPRDSRTQTPVVEPNAPALAYKSSPVQTLIVTPAPNRIGRMTGKPTCYAMRSYKFGQETEGFGSPPQEGSSACELASNTHWKAMAVAPSK